MTTQGELFKRFLKKKEKIKKEKSKIYERLNKKINNISNKKMSYKKVLRKQPRVTLVLRKNHIGRNSI